MVVFNAVASTCYDGAVLLSSMNRPTREDPISQKVSSILFLPIPDNVLRHNMTTSHTYDMI